MSASEGSCSEPDDDQEYIPDEKEEEWVSEDEEILEEEYETPRKKSKKCTKFQDDNIDANFMTRTSSIEEENTFVDYKRQWRLSATIWEKLFPYQRKGLKWLCSLDENQEGGVLADEMGLGKSVQVACFLRSIEESAKETVITRKPGLSKSILICPSTLIPHWINIFNEWFPKLRVFLLHRTATSRPSANFIKECIKFSKTGPMIIITTYRGFETYSNHLTKHTWHYVFLDEGHIIKNDETKIYRHITNIQTPHRIIVTGTPVQNNLREFWNIMNFVTPGLFGRIEEFEKNTIVPIMVGLRKSATSFQKALSLNLSQQLQNSSKRNLLRREKDEVLDDISLPRKVDKVVFCELTDVQRRLYERYIQSDEVKQIKSRKLDIGVGVVKLQHICNHPAIYLKEKLDFYDPNMSGKLSVLQELLRRWKKKDTKILIFSQKRTALDVIERLLKKLKLTHVVLDGSVAQKKRIKLIEQFQNDEETRVFLLTTRTGGVGINLTAANKVIIYDPDWNPTVDEQAKERAYRVGQKRDVEIVRLCTAGTIEEYILQRQLKKEFLAKRILNHSPGSVLNLPEASSLFSLEDQGVSGTETGAMLSGFLREEFKDDDAEEAGSSSSTHANRKILKMANVRSILEKATFEDTPDATEDEQKRAREISEKALMDLRANKGNVNWKDEYEENLEAQSKFKARNMMDMFKQGAERLEAVKQPKNKYSCLALRLRNFLSIKNRTSAEIQDAFQKKLEPHEHVIFKEILKSIGKKKSSGSWKLRKSAR